MFPYISQYAYSGEFFSKLQQCFEVWQEKNYQNDLFSNTMSVNPTYLPSEIKTIQAVKDVLFFSNTLSSPGPQNLQLTPKTIAAEKTRNEPVQDFSKSFAPLPSLDNLQLSHDMIIAASKQKEMSARVNTVKNILFQTIWLDEIVRNFSYHDSSLNYFVSFDRYNQDRDFIRFIAELVENICKIGSIKIKPITILYNMSLNQINDLAIEAINQA